MELQAGYRFRTAPRFHRGFRWSDCIRLNSGVDPSLRPRPDWRPPTDAELSLLVEDSDAAEPVDDSGAAHIQLFAIPGHLRSRWWAVADQLSEAPIRDSPAYQSFVRDVASFLSFKDLPLPPRCAFDVVLSSAGVNAPAPESHTAGATLPEGPPRNSPISSTVVAAINLGDGPVSLVFLNLPPAHLMAHLHCQAEDGPSAIARVPQFLTAFPDYPLVRLFLQPGEGVWLPLAGGAFHHYPGEQQDIDVWLVVRALADNGVGK